MRLVLPAVLCCGLLTLSAGTPTMPAGLVQPEPARPLPEETGRRFGWPLEPPEVSRPFDAPESDFGPGHRGVDLAGAPGQPVLAAADGTVGYAGTLVDRGVVAIDHAGGLRTSYEPVTPAVRTGDQVIRGQVIGHLVPGHPGCVPRTCLHWGLRRGQQYLDPLSLVTPGHVRLLPWD